jgi:uncharacterized protein
MSSDDTKTSSSTSSTTCTTDATPGPEHVLDGNNRFVWFDLETKSAEAAQTFYSAVFGHKFSKVPNQQVWMQAPAGTAADDIMTKAIASLSERPEDDRQCWVLYVQVEDIKASFEKAKELGASVVTEIEDMGGGAGHIARLRDVGGAIFGLYQEDKRKTPPFKFQLGAPCWCELMTRGSEEKQEREFYNNLFGWSTFVSHETYSTFARSEEENSNMVMIGGTMSYPASAECASASEPATQWLFYISTEDCDKATELAKANGATVLHGPMSIPHGRISTVVDPVGVVVGIWSPQPGGGATAGDAHKRKASDTPESDATKKSRTESDE